MSGVNTNIASCITMVWRIARTWCPQFVQDVEMRNINRVIDQALRENASRNEELTILRARVAELEAQNRHDDEADTACRNLLCEERDAAESLRDRYRAGLAEMSEELGHYPEGPGIFGHLKGILRRTLSPQDVKPAVPECLECSGKEIDMQHYKEKWLAAEARVTELEELLLPHLPARYTRL